MRKKACNYDFCVVISDECNRTESSEMYILRSLPDIMTLRSQLLNTYIKLHRGAYKSNVRPTLDV